MMEIYIPDIYQKNIYTINYNMLISRGIKCLLFDLDNTLITVIEKYPKEETKTLFRNLKEEGFKIVIFSNSPKIRVKAFAKELNVDYIFTAKKPHVEKMLEFIRTNKFELSEIAIIGDSMMDDVLCGNTVGITTILTDQLDKKEFPLARLRRIKEKMIQKKLRDEDLFVKGRYYE